MPRRSEAAVTVRWVMVASARVVLSGGNATGIGLDDEPDGRPRAQVQILGTGWREVYYERDASGDMRHDGGSVALYGRNPSLQNVPRTDADGWLARHQDVAGANGHRNAIADLGVGQRHFQRDARFVKVHL